jgi:hypothetical protein
LTRIESYAFSSSSLQSILIPRKVQFIDGSAFIGVRLSSISIESGNEYFVVENEFLIDIVDHRLIRNFSSSSDVEIASNIEILGCSCFSSCTLLSSISFESNSRLTRIESNAFSDSSLQSIVIPSTVQILGSSCFFYCKSLSSISFESNSQLTRIESDAFSCSSLESIVIPSTVQILGSSCFSYCESLSSISFESNSQLTRIESLPFEKQDFEVIIPSTISFIAFDAIPKDFQIFMADCDSCAQFDRWQQRRKLDIAVDFRRNLKIDSEFHGLNDYQIDHSVFEKQSFVCNISELVSEMYERSDDSCLMIVTTKDVFESTGSLKHAIEHLLNLCHPCIVSPIGFDLYVNQRVCTELKIVGLFWESSSLSEVISKNPIWWTATAKAKAVAGIVLGLRFAHSLGLVHGHLNSQNIRFDVDHHIQIAGFCEDGQEVDESANDTDVLSEEIWSPYVDMVGFVCILIEIIVGHRVIESEVATGEVSLPPNIPTFVSRFLETVRSRESGIRKSFGTIFDDLKMNDFGIVSGVDSEEVLSFVRWVESFE